MSIAAVVKATTDGERAAAVLSLTKKVDGVPLEVEKAVPAVMGLVKVSNEC